MSKPSCLICFAIERQIPQDVMLDEFGATALWRAMKEHEDEQHLVEMKDREKE